MHNVALMVAAVLIAVQAGAARSERTPPGSFVKYKVFSVQQLVDEVSRDKYAASLFAKHFGVSTAEVEEYFRQNLRLAKLTKPMPVMVYGVTKTGMIVGKQRGLPKGAYVFLAPNGQAVLKAPCANPVRKTLPEATVAAKLPSEIQPEVVAKVLASPTEVLTPATETIVPPVPSPVELDASVLVEEIPSSNPVIVPPSLISALAILPLLGLETRHNDVTTPVPEPGSWIVLSSGAMAIVGRFAMRRRTRR